MHRGRRHGSPCRRRSPERCSLLEDATRLARLRRVFNVLDIKGFGQIDGRVLVSKPPNQHGAQQETKLHPLLKKIGDRDGMVSAPRFCEHFAAKLSADPKEFFGEVQRFMAAAEEYRDQSENSRSKSPGAQRGTEWREQRRDSYGMHANFRKRFECESCEADFESFEEAEQHIKQATPHAQLAPHSAQ